MNLTQRTAIACAISFTLCTASFATPSFNDAYASYNAALEANDTQAVANYARQAYELGLVKYADSPSNKLNLKHNLALALASNKQSEQAFTLMSDVLDEIEERHGDDSEDYYFALLDTLATFDHMTTNMLIQRKRTFNKIVFEALDVAQERVEQAPDQAATTYYILAKQLNLSPTSTVFFKQAMEATTFAESALMKSVGPEDVRTVEMQFKLGQFNTALRNRDDAIAYFESIVATVNNAMETSHPYELASHANLVSLYETIGESDKATNHCIAIGKMKPWRDDIDQMPLHRAEPKYPKSYAIRRVEGSVVMRFNIDDYGFVREIEVVESEGGRLFSKEAKKALEKWRYAPKIQNGVAVETTGHMVRLDFRIDG